MSERESINLENLSGITANLTRSKHNLSPYEEVLPDKIKVVIRALGTMIIVPDYDKGDILAGDKPVYKGGIQQPILNGKDRELAVNKLVELINQL